MCIIILLYFYYCLNAFTSTQVEFEVIIIMIIIGGGGNELSGCGHMYNIHVAIDV